MQPDAFVSYIEGNVLKIWFFFSMKTFLFEVLNQVLPDCNINQRELKRSKGKVVFKILSQGVAGSFRHSIKLLCTQRKLAPVHIQYSFSAPLRPSADTNTELDNANWKFFL